MPKLKHALTNAARVRLKTLLFMRTFIRRFSYGVVATSRGDHRLLTAGPEVPHRRWERERCSVQFRQTSRRLLHLSQRRKTAHWDQIRSLLLGMTATTNREW
jgi:hypothetical protein